MTATDIISYIEAVPLVLKYIAPGFIFLWIYTRLHDKKLPEHYIMCSVVVSFILVLCVNNVVWDFVIAVVAALIVYVLSRTTWVKNLFKKTISFSPSKTVFYDVIDYEKGTYIYVKTDKWIVSGIYIGIDKDTIPRGTKFIFYSKPEKRVEYIKSLNSADRKEWFTDNDINDNCAKVVFESSEDNRLNTLWMEE